MKSYIITFLCIVLLLSCQKQDRKLLQNTRLKSYVITYDNDFKKEVYRGQYDYSTTGLLITETQNDTTFFKNTNQYNAVYTIFENFYNEDDYLTKRVRSAISLQLTNTAVTTYEYRNGRLSLENFGNRVTEYRYNQDGSLKTTISTSLNSGNKNILEYENGLPVAVKANDNGYLIESENEKTYLNKDLLITRYERYRNGSLILEQDYDQQKDGLPQSYLPLYKGWPHTKAPGYQKGVQKNIVTYQIINGERVLTDEKRLMPTFDPQGLLIKNIGYETINQELTTSETRQISFEYEYENF